VARLHFAPLTFHSFNFAAYIVLRDFDGAASSSCCLRSVAPLPPTSISENPALRVARLCFLSPCACLAFRLQPMATHGWGA
jgi:hypothetical protein